VQPKWRQDGRELYYLNPDGKLMVVDIQADSGITAGKLRDEANIACG
jgi:hypothetical protein